MLPPHVQSAQRTTIDHCCHSSGFGSQASGSQIFLFPGISRKSIDLLNVCAEEALQRWRLGFWGLNSKLSEFRFVEIRLMNATMVTATVAPSCACNIRTAAGLSLQSQVSTSASSHMFAQTLTRHGRSLQVSSGRRRSFGVRASVDEGGSSSSSSGDDDADDSRILKQVERADWRAFRARLVRSGLGTGGLDSVQDQEQDLWAHPLVKPEAGCLLIAHPNAFTNSQQYFHRVVIFIFAHDAGGSAGVILNRPTQYSLGQLEEFKDLMPEMTDCPLYFGGDVGPECTQVIHGVAGFEDSREIMKGVFMGGTARIQESVRSGKSTPNDFRWFLRFAGWGPGQLEQEVAAGVWYLASCSKKFVLKQCIQLPKPLWNEVMEHMGPPYSDIAKRAK